MRESVKQMWEGFADKVLPTNCPPGQYVDMRRAFYGGAWVMLMACSGLGEDSVSEDDGVTALEAWREECEQFYRDVASGRA